MTISETAVSKTAISEMRERKLTIGALSLADL